MDDYEWDALDALEDQCLDDGEDQKDEQELYVCIRADIQRKETDAETL